MHRMQENGRYALELPQKNLRHIFIKNSHSSCGFHKHNQNQTLINALGIATGAEAHFIEV